MMEIDYDKLWNEVREIVEQEVPVTKRDFEKTMDELKREWGVTAPIAEKAVQKLLTEGKLGSRTAISRNGRLCTVYWPL